MVLTFYFGISFVNYKKKIQFTLSLAFVNFVTLNWI